MRSFLLRLLAGLAGVLAAGAAVPPSPEIALVWPDGRRLVLADLAPAGADASAWSGRTADGALTATVRTVDATALGPYHRTIVTLANTGAGELAPARLVLLDRPAPAGARVVGDFRGSPVVAGDTFLGVEHPLADNRVTDGRVHGELALLRALGPGESLTVSAVEGRVPEATQLRRGFLAYLERERARPYAPFLHHNTWYNLGYFTPFTAGDELALIDRLGTELVTRRGVHLDGFVLDDGWDDVHSLWRFHAGWPDGVKPMAVAAARFGAAPGMWLSPWGGYGKPRAARLAAAAPEGFEMRDGHFSLAGPRYFARFRERCAGVVRDGAVAYFKFDGIGSDETGVIDPAAGRDFEAMLRLVHELRALRPGLYVSQTTGTWPSPWWLRHVDNIWRDGDDHDFAGVGTKRQQWMTYRDAQTYANVVRRGPLYPLNSLMVHGIIYAAKAKDLASDPGHDFRAEVRSYFGNGTQLQELYLSPELLAAADWDDLAAAARWARANTATLCDTHWVGGDPARGEVYGWAAWSPAKGIVTLRNPAAVAAEFPLEVGAALELPAAATGRFAVTGAYPDAPSPVATAVRGEPVRLRLQPFEVLVLEFVPTPAGVSAGR